jgi:hypothetical protein
VTDVNADQGNGILGDGPEDVAGDFGAIDHAVLVVDEIREEVELRRGQTGRRVLDEDRTGLSIDRDRTCLDHRAFLYGDRRSWVDLRTDL